MINIVIPMAGRGSRFSNAGYIMPKPLIDIYGHPMIEYVTKNIRPKLEHKFIYICQKEHIEKYGIDKILKKEEPNCVIVTIDHITDGAACTVLLAEKYINNNDQLMIANSDQFVDISIDKYLEAIGEYDGLIMTMPANDPKWSYIKYGKDHLVSLVREKEVISNEATVGIYNYKKGKDFVEAANKMINQNIRVNNEFYVAPAYNEMIKDKKKITFFDIGQKMHGLGIPEDLENFKKLDLCKKFFN
jgi:dTDP-glucose pyrophosphorylase